MRLIRPSFQIMEVMGLSDLGGFNNRHLKIIERAGRTCYKSEDKITNESAIKFVKARIGGHESVIEHSAMTVRLICDRGVTHETVRHRLCAFSQESTRYCNYAKSDEITVIEPFFFDPFEEPIKIQVPNVMLEISKDKFSVFSSYLMNSFDVWFLTCLWTEWGYMTLINSFNRTPQEARSVLPNSLKTEIVVTANFREWRHIFKLRCANESHPQMQEIMRPLLAIVKEHIPVIFDDITY